MYIRDGLPEKDDFVIATVVKVSQHQVELTLDEYKSVSGILHSSEMHRKIVRTMRIFFKPGRKVVCKVIAVNQNGISLSIRRVGASQERTKEQEWKNEKIADEIISLAAKQGKIKYDTLFERVGPQLLKKYNLLYPFFSEVARDEELINELKLDKKIKTILTTSIKRRIKPKTALIKFNVFMQSKASNGLEVIKSTIKTAKDFAKERGGKLTVKYISAPKYQFIFEHREPKTAPKITDDLFNALSKTLNKKQGTIEYEEIK